MSISNKVIRDAINNTRWVQNPYCQFWKHSLLKTNPFVC